MYSSMDYKQHKDKTLHFFCFHFLGFVSFVPQPVFLASSSRLDFRP